MTQRYELPKMGIVRTVHILNDGTQIYSKDDYEPVADRFSWVDRSEILKRIFKLNKITESRKKSIIAIYENGRYIKEYKNVDLHFVPLGYA